MSHNFRQLLIDAGQCLLEDADSIRDCHTRDEKWERDADGYLVEADAFALVERRLRLAARLVTYADLVAPPPREDAS